MANRRPYASAASARRGSDAPEQFEFDAAISFLSQDAGFAERLKDAIGPSLNVFVYSRNQETVAATDGMDSFHTVFRQRARLSVVLYRTGWGNTQWTGVEEVAIKDRCLATKYRSLALVNLDASKTPDWVPDSYIYLDAAAYSVEQLAGVIKSRCQDLGSTIRKVSLADRAAQVEKQRAFDAETVRLLEGGTAEWIQARDALTNAVEAEARKVAEGTGWVIACGPGALIGGFAVIAASQSLQIKEVERYANTARNAYLEVREYDSKLLVERPGERYTATGPLEVVLTTRVKIRRTPSMGWCWEMDGKTRSAEHTAEAIVEKLVDRVEAEFRSPRRRKNVTHPHAKCAAAHARALSRYPTRPTFCARHMVAARQCAWHPFAPPPPKNSGFRPLA